jgi:hypothetical protein
MKMDISKVDVWAATIQDKPGALAAKLDALAAAKANLGFVIARRTPEKRGRGVVYVTPLSGARQLAAARRAGFGKARGLNGLMVTAADRPGLGAKLTSCIAAAGINVRGVSAAALGRKSVCHFAFDSAADANRAMRVLKSL